MQFPTSLGPGIQSPEPWTQEYSPMGPGMQFPGPWTQELKKLNESKDLCIKNSP